MKPWKPYRLVFGSDGRPGSASRLDRVTHVTHADTAQRILEDGRLAGRLVDDGVLGQHRASVTWLSPKQWPDGSRFGSIGFSFDFDTLMEGRRLYWVEAIQRETPACRFLLTDRKVKDLPVVRYDPETSRGPLRLVDGTWWWNPDIVLELMIEGDLALDACSAIGIFRHHLRMCGRGSPYHCEEAGRDGDGAAGRLVAGILSRRTALSTALLLNRSGRDVSDTVERGLFQIMEVLGAGDDALNGPLGRRKSVASVLTAALCQLATGDARAAASTAGLVASDAALLRALNRLCLDRTGVRSALLIRLEPERAPAPRQRLRRTPDAGSEHRPCPEEAVRRSVRMIGGAVRSRPRNDPSGPEWTASRRRPSSAPR